jgi:hypothetical protein
MAGVSRRLPLCHWEDDYGQKLWTADKPVSSFFTDPLKKHFRLLLKAPIGVVIRLIFEP